MKTFQFEVRDYECDLQGVVNNSVYLNYLEHARHKYIKFLGLDFAELHTRGIDPMVTRIEMDYKASLRPGDEFEVRVFSEREGRLRFIFNQEIWRQETLCLKAKVTAAILVNGRPGAPEEVVKAFEKD